MRIANHPDGSFTIDGVRYVYRNVWPTGREMFPATREDMKKRAAQRKAQAERAAAEDVERKARWASEDAAAAKRPGRGLVVYECADSE